MAPALLYKPKLKKLIVGLIGVCKRGKFNQICPNPESSIVINAKQ